MKTTIRQLQDHKTTGRKIVMLTSYDYPGALIQDRCGVDIQLVGDSVGTNMLGYDDVSQVTLQDMIHHVRAVARGAQRSFVLCDMPYRTFETPAQAVENARLLIEAGADGVKIEGEAWVVPVIAAVCAAGITVCAHIGYTPQTDGAQARVQGRDLHEAGELITTARLLEAAGAALMVLELIPEQVSDLLTRNLRIPTIGIGAGRFCDGQVQVIYDIAGLSARVYRHAKAYDTLGARLQALIETYCAEVRDNRFPTEANAVRLNDDIARRIDQHIAQQLSQTGETP